MGNIAPSDNSLWYRAMRPHDRKAIYQIQGLSGVCCTVAPSLCHSSWSGLVLYNFGEILYRLVRILNSLVNSNISFYASTTHGVLHQALLLPTLRHPLVPGGPYHPLSVGWFLSYAPLRYMRSARLCRNAKPNQSCIGLLLQYKNQSCQVVEQWRWDYSIGEPLLIYCQNDHAQSQNLAVEIQVSAMNTVSYDDTWDYHPLQGQTV